MEGRERIGVGGGRWTVGSRREEEMRLGLPTMAIPGRARGPVWFRRKDSVACSRNAGLVCSWVEVVMLTW